MNLRISKERLEFTAVLDHSPKLKLKISLKQRCALISMMRCPLQSRDVSTTTITLIASLDLIPPRSKSSMILNVLFKVQSMDSTFVYLLTDKQALERPSLSKEQNKTQD